LKGDYVAEESFGIGLVVPSSNTVMERDFHRSFVRPAVVSTTRIFLEAVTREAEEKMNREELPLAIRLIKTVAPRVVVFGCTSAGSLDGAEHDAAIARFIADYTGAQPITVIGSVLAQLQNVRPSRVAVFTPYQEEMTRSVTDCIVEAGFTLVKAAGMGIVDNREIGRVTPDEIVRFVEEQSCDVDVDCVFLSCTNWRAIETIGRLQRLLGARVLSSNQACIDEVLRFMDGLVPVGGEGLPAQAGLFSQRPA
jgi:maleate isomerase